MVNCKKCDRGFITCVQFESLDSTESTEIVYCSNALCEFSRTMIKPTEKKAWLVEPMVVN